MVLYEILQLGDWKYAVLPLLNRSMFCLYRSKTNSVFPWKSCSMVFWVGFVLWFFFFFKRSAGHLERWLQAITVPSDKWKTSRLIVVKNLYLKS